MTEAEQGDKVRMATAIEKAAVVEALRGLLKSEAWRILRLKLEGDVKVINAQQMMCSNPNELLRYAGRLYEIEAMLSWPKFQADALAAQLEKAK